MREFSPQEVRFSMNVEWDDTMLDADIFDKATRKYIAEQAAEGNTWAWCVVTMQAKWAGFTGIDSLCNCSYKSLEDFVASNDYYVDMLRESTEHLIGEIRASGWELEVPDGAVEAAVDRGIREAAQNCKEEPYR